MSPRFLTLEDVAEELATSKAQIVSLVRSGELMGIQIGGRNQWRVERSKLEEYIAEQYRRAERLRGQIPPESDDVDQ